MPSDVKISVVIPVKNESTGIRNCIDGILSQVAPVAEIIVVDSGSTDGTLDILREYEVVKIIEISPQEFNHGETRNRGISRATGDFVLFTVGDARPYDNNWTKNLLSCFDDAAVDAAYGLQVVAHSRSNNPMEWYRPQSVPRTRTYYFESKSQFDALEPEEKRQACALDNVTAMYRKEVLLEVPFRKTTYWEDGFWAMDALRRGYKIVFNPAARVYHYHCETKDYTFRRSFTVYYHRYRFFGLAPEKHRFLQVAIRTFYHLSRNMALTWRERLHWFRYSVENQWSLRRSNRLFRKTLKRGEDVLDRLHGEVCARPPVLPKSK